MNRILNQIINLETDKAERKNQKSSVKISKDRMMDFLRLAQYGADKKTQAIFSFKNNLLKCGIHDSMVHLEYLIDVEYPQLEELVFSLNATKLYDFLRKLDIKSDFITFHIEDALVLIEHSLGRGEIAKGKATDEFSLYSITEQPLVKYEVNSSNFIEQLRILKNYIASETNREQFSGLSIESDSELKIWSTDGHILCMGNLHAELPLSKYSCILSKRLVDCISSIMPGKNAQLILHKTHSVYKQDHVSLASPLVSAHVLPINKILDDISTCLLQIEIDSTELSKQIERVSIFSCDLKKIFIVYDIKEGLGMILSHGNTGDSGYENINNAIFKLKEGADTKVQICVGSAQLLSILRGLRGQISLQYYSHKSNIVIQKKSGGYPMYVVAVHRN